MLPAENKAGIFPLTAFIQYCTQGLTRQSRNESEIKKYNDWKLKVLGIVCVENPKESDKKGRWRRG